jgi:hypothetical protein
MRIKDRRADKNTRQDGDYRILKGRRKGRGIDETDDEADQPEHRADRHADDQPLGHRPRRNDNQYDKCRPDDPEKACNRGREAKQEHQPQKNRQQSDLSVCNFVISLFHYFFPFQFLFPLFISISMFVLSILPFLFPLLFLSA